MWLLFTTLVTSTESWVQWILFRGIRKTRSQSKHTRLDFYVNSFEKKNRIIFFLLF